MFQYFAKEWNGEPFSLFGTGHLIAIAVLVMINLTFIWLRKSQDQKLKDRVRYVLAIILLVSEGSWHIWNLATDQWSYQKHLPFHICSVLIWLGIIMLFTRNYAIYEFVYFLGIGGALQAVITPEAGIYGFPHYRVFQTLFAHGTLVTAGVFMTVVEGFRPYWSSFKRVFIWTNIYMTVVTIINLLIDSNYLYTLRKPDTASLMDVLGPWPLYLLSLEIVALVICFILYLPFLIGDRRKIAAATA